MVDSFAPVIDHIEREVVAVDLLVAGMEDDVPDTRISSNNRMPPFSISVDPVKDQPTEAETKAEKPTRARDDSDAISNASSQSVKLDLPPPRRLSIPVQVRSFFQRIRIALGFRTGKDKDKGSGAPLISPRLKTLLRMTTTRRIVTSLGRLLAPKSEVIGQIQKRLRGGMGGEARNSDIEIYFGDIQGELHVRLVRQSRRPRARTR